MPSATVTPLRPVTKLVPLVPESDLSAILAETFALADAEPRLLDLIDRDRDAHATAKKKVRLEDRAWLAARATAPLPGLDVSVEARWLDDVELAVGRPRLPAICVLLFLVLRGYLGGFKDRKVAMLLLESRTIEICLAGLGIALPGASTLIDNINAVRVSTLEAILDAQVRQVRREGLDDFKELTFDSTKVKANSAWPTDSGIITGLIFRAEHLIRLLADQGILLRLPAAMETIMATAKELNKQIQLSAGKKDSKEKRAKLYRRLLRLARQAKKALAKAQERAAAKLTCLDVAPSQRRQVAKIVQRIQDDVRDLGQMITNADKRINRNKKVPIDDKVLSLADEDAAMIVKGEREAVVGYKPQLGRSKSGFVVALIVPEGNAADSGQIEQIVDAAMKRTGVVPDVLSFDDGYTNTAARDRYIADGIEVVSFSGSKGKRIIPAEDYESEAYRQARNDRSSVESLMFTLKHNHDLDRVMRRGLTCVRAELLEKAIAYNFFCLIRRRREAAERLAAA